MPDNKNQNIKKTANRQSSTKAKDGAQKNLMYDKAEHYFKCSARERAVFEAGIKLGAIYHQFVGTPVSNSNVEVLEKAIEDGVRIQPFVSDVIVKIDRDKLKNKNDEYDYDSLSGNMLDVKLVINYKNKMITAKLEFIKELNYPLMYVSTIQ
jgi:hypothetical protein